MAVQIDNVIQTASLFKLLSDPTRCRIINLLLVEKDGMCVSELAEAVDVSHSAMSHQLAKLEARGIVEGFREGQSFCYMLRNNETTYDLRRLMKIFRNA